MDLLNKIKDAGVVGCGGAGFPTHIKLNAKPDYFIINGAECEPLLHTDRYIMTHLADRLIRRGRCHMPGTVCPGRIYRAEKDIPGGNPCS